MGKEGTEQLFLGLHDRERREHVVGEFKDIARQMVRQVDPFRMLPDLFHWIQLRRVRGQVFKMNTIATPVFDTAFRCAVGIETIPHDDQLPLELALDPPDK